MITCQSARVPRTLILKGLVAQALMASALAGFLAGCNVHGASDSVTSVGALASITVTPNATLVVNGAQQMVAVGHDAAGDIVSISPTWSVGASGGTITATGMFSAGSTIGVFANTVTASVGSISGRATITVTAGPLMSITLTPNPVTLAVAGAQQFTAVGKDAGGNVVQFTPTWSIVAGGGTITQAGVFTAGSVAGTYANTVQVSGAGVTALATVTVTAAVVTPVLTTLTVTPNPASVVAGATQQFVAAGKDQNGNAFAVTPIWSVVNGGGSINASSGIFTAGATAGTFIGTIQATSGSVSGVATVTVTAIVVTPVLTTITVTPNPASVPAGGTQQFVAAGKDQNGNAFVITPIWSVGNGGGTINAGSGIFTAGAIAGSFPNTVVATVGAISGNASVTVTAIVVTPFLASITVTPNPASVAVGGTQQFYAAGKDQNGNAFLVTPIWSVVNGGGTINAGSGIFTGGAGIGTFFNTIQATSGTISGMATVTITAAAPSINLGTAALDGIMAGTAVTCATSGTINADVSISPGNTITGFPSATCVITGATHLNDAVAIQNQIDLTAAYNQLAGMACAPSNVITADLGGTTKAAGIWCSASTIGVTGPLTLDGGGNPNAVFVFQAGSSLTTAGNIILINGAQAKNVYWVLGTAGSGSATLGTASAWQGNILALTSISMNASATLNGRALARNGAVTLTTGNTIILP